ncbi:Transposase [Caenorhabditis elegans]|uniref:Transposase n=1 Tax=Caenorhabditis elegans TaxID=6239 RepID=G1K0X2_CAEEL|nr:Transposase [Caenorhabditis elegans]CCC42153.1 Transposase [Caenorhabditis elegans]|eukprot:NP_001256261.1 Uncharacterized protein CELE_C29A12.22 [Caenorhabditis elegans]
MQTPKDKCRQDFSSIYNNSRSVSVKDRPREIVSLVLGLIIAILFRALVQETDKYVN